MAVPRMKVLSLYRNLIRESKKFQSYNFRMYFIDKTRHEFRENISVTDSVVTEKLIKQAEENLEVIKRQVIVGQMYGEGKLVIENEEYMKKQR